MRALAAPLVLTSLAACSSAAPPVIAGRSAVRAAPPAGPAPHLAWDDSGTPPVDVDAADLPAVARAGDIVVVPLTDNDGGRGNWNLRIEIRDRSDRIVETIGIATANEYEVLVPDGTHASGDLIKRIVRANDKLEALHERHDLVAMHGFEPGNTVGRSTPVEGDGLVVTFGDDNQLRVRTRDGKQLASVDGTAWLPRSGPRCPGCPPCENHAWLGGFYTAPGITTLVARITFDGTDTCWEPPDQLHVVAW